MIDSTCEHAEATPNFSVDAISRSLLSKPLNAKYSQQTFVPLVSNNSKHTAFVSMYRGSLLCSVDLSETDKTWLSNSNWKIAPKVSNELVEEQVIVLLIALRITQAHGYQSWLLDGKACMPRSCCCRLTEKVHVHLEILF